MEERDFAKEYGIRFRQIRMARGISQQKLADLMHVTPQAVSKWEKEGVTNVNTVQQLSNVLGQDITADQIDQEGKIGEVGREILNILIANQGFVDYDDLAAGLYGMSSERVSNEIFKLERIGAVVREQYTDYLDQERDSVIITAKGLIAYKNCKEFPDMAGIKSAETMEMRLGEQCPSLQEMIDRDKVGRILWKLPYCGPYMLDYIFHLKKHFLTDFPGLDRTMVPVTTVYEILGESCFVQNLRKKILAAGSITRCKVFFMKRFVAFCLITTLLALSGCVNKNDDNVSVIGGADGPTSIYLNASDDTGNNFTQIDQETAKLMMELDDGHVIVDVRREDEFAEGHIPEAILIPNESIGTEQPAELPDLEQIILVYCRSGRRSKEASQKLADIGYTNVYEFGGIIDWTGEIVTDEAAEKTEEVVSMKLKIDSIEVPVTWEDNDSVDALKNLSPLTVEMSMYGGFEQVGSIGKSIAKDDKQTTTDYGDIVLYSGNQIVIFYGSNSWAYTRLGHIDMSQEELTELLGAKDVTVMVE